MLRRKGLASPLLGVIGEEALIAGRDLSPEHVKATYGSYFESIEELQPVPIQESALLRCRFIWRMPCTN